MLIFCLNFGISNFNCDHSDDLELVCTNTTLSLRKSSFKQAVTISTALVHIFLVEIMWVCHLQVCQVNSRCRWMMSIINSMAASAIRD